MARYRGLNSVDKDPNQPGGIFSVYYTMPLGKSLDKIAALSYRKIFTTDYLGSLSALNIRYQELLEFWKEKKEQVARPTFEVAVLEKIDEAYNTAKVEIEGRETVTGSVDGVFGLVKPIIESTKSAAENQIDLGRVNTK